MSEKKTHGSNPGVGCDVIACKYNTVDCRCVAERISVQNENASTKGERKLLSVGVVSKRDTP